MPLFITFDRYSHVASLTLNAYELIIPGFDENCILKFNTETAHVSFCPKNTAELSFAHDLTNTDLLMFYLRSSIRLEGPENVRAGALILTITVTRGHFWLG